MAHATNHSRAGWWILAGLVILALWTTASASGRTLRRRFFAALRIERPEAVSVNVPAFSGPTGSRRLQDAIPSMLADQVTVAPESRDTAVADSAAAARLAGFAPLLPAARTDRPSFAVQTERRMTMIVNRDKLLTVLREAGQAGTAVPPASNGATLSITTPAAVIASYGHCPALEGQTLTNQIAQRPPPAAENADCVILTQRPAVSAQAPDGFDMRGLTTIALEVAGMSPNQTADFERAIPWAAALALTMPRFMRSYDTVTVNGATGMLINTVFRRGPSYELLWTRDGRVFTLTGYGNSADAVAIARSVSAAGGRR